MTFPRYRIHLWWLVPLLIFDVIFFAWWWNRFPSPLPSESKPVPTAGDKSIRVKFAYPTDRELDRIKLENFQPTASGRPESAFYGSVRIERLGKSIFPSFHEGIDIAPVRRDRSGCPLDVVMAAADGEIAYVNRVAGNSNYGKYIVLAHGAGAGRLYTLYAHLDKIAPDLRLGGRIGQGTSLGIMGFSSTDHIPPANGHLHFEICLMLNSCFQQWFKIQKLTPDHGNYNGWNLIGIDPLAVYEKQEENDENEYDLYAHLTAIPRAFEIVFKTPHRLDFFRRYPTLWRDVEFRGGAMIIACSENGLPLSGRCASGSEIAEFGRRIPAVRSVDRSALGRNGCRLVVNENGKWQLSAEGKKWLSMLAY